MLSNPEPELPLLRTKISVPPIPPEFVRRPRLTDRVNRGVKGPLTLLSAPAGFGKTNLLVEWTAETQLSVAWLMLDDEDNQGETQPAEIPCLHRRAATWFEQRGNLDEACSHALAAGDGEWAADLIERNIEASIKAGELLALTRWIGKLPDQIIRQRPRLSLPYAGGLITAYQLDRARFWLDRVERSLIDRQPDEETSPDPGRSASLWNIKGGLAICRFMLALISGNVQQAAEFSRAAMDSLHEDNPFIHSTVALEDSLYFILSGDTSKAIEAHRETARIARGANNVLVLVVATCELAGMQAMQGHLSQALVTLQKAQFMALGPDGNPLPLAGIVDVEFGEILRERDLLRKAKEYLERGRQLTQARWSLSSLEGLISLARVLQSQGDIDGAQALIDEASSLALSTESSRWDDVFVSAIAARLALQRNDLATAAQFRRPGFSRQKGRRSRAFK